MSDPSEPMEKMAINFLLMAMRQRCRSYTPQKMPPMIIHWKSGQVILLLNIPIKKEFLS